jgi:F-type H+-transporting ATPase subunit b
MELNWTTFLLEIFNFLILVWILKHFFYRPLQAAIARRQAAIEERVEAARKMQEDAKQLQQTYEHDLADIAQKRDQAWQELQRELRDERKKKQKELADALQQQRQKAEVIEQREVGEVRRQQQKRALQQGSRFATRLLEDCAGPELQARLLALTLDSLRKLPQDQLAALRQQVAGSRGAENETVPAPVMVASAFTLSAQDRTQVEQTLADILQHKVHCDFSEDVSLIAGLNIAIGPWVLGANVRDELQGFAALELDAVSD